MEHKLMEETEKSLKELLDEGITTNNLDYVYKLTKIKHMNKEDMNMNYGNYMGNYGNYGRGYGEGSYGEYGRGGSYGRERYGNEYGRRGVDAKYRGQEQLDRMAGEYGRYSESYGRYGAGQETDRSFHYMIKALEDFIKVLYEEADNENQKQQLRETLQRSMM